MASNSSFYTYNGSRHASQITNGYGLFQPKRQKRRILQTLRRHHRKGEIDFLSITVSMHRTPHISYSRFSHRELKPQSYCEEDLARALISYLDHQNSGDTTLRMREGMREFEKNGCWPNHKPESLESMRHAFHVLDDVFFNGLLSGYCDLSMPEAPAHNPTRRGSCKVNYPGDSHPLLKDRRGLYCCVKVHPSPSYSASGWKRAGRYQDVLVHEMLHAYFLMYTCRCERGCKANSGGYRGHSPALMLASKAIEDSKINRTFVEEGPKFFEMCLRRERAMAQAVRKGDRMPSDQELRRLGLNVEGIIRLMRVLEEEEDAMANKRPFVREETRKPRERRPEQSKHKSLLAKFLGL